MKNALHERAGSFACASVVEHGGQPFPEGVGRFGHQLHSAGGDVAGDESIRGLHSAEAKHVILVPAFLGPN
jgi:hypothetical protein